MKDQLTKFLVGHTYIPNNGNRFCVNIIGISRTEPHYIVANFYRYGYDNGEFSIFHYWKQAILDCHQWALAPLEFPWDDGFRAIYDPDWIRVLEDKI